MTSSTYPAHDGNVGAPYNDARIPLSRVRAILSISDTLMQAEHEAEAFVLAARNLVEQGCCATCWIATIDYETSRLHGKAVAGQHIAEELGSVVLPLEHFPIVAEMIVTGEPCVVSDSVTQSEAEGWNDLARQIGLPSFICFPFGPGSEVSGLITIGIEKDTLIDEAVALLGLSAQLIASTVIRLQAVAERAQQLAALHSAMHAQEQLLETVRQLSTPVIPIHDGILIMPLIGNIDTTRAGQVLETVLEGIAREQASVLIIDVTGVPIIDTGVAHHLVQVTQAAQLLGARALLVGIKPEVAQTLVQLGVDLRNMTTRSNLQAGVAFAFEQLGLHVTRAYH